MKKVYITLYVLSVGILSANAQMIPANVKIRDDQHKLSPVNQSSTKRSIQAPTQCEVDTVEYPYYKASSLRSITISKGRSLGQLYSCPKPLVLSGFTFYAFAVPTTPPSGKKMNLICNVYKAGPDSLPWGLPLRSDTILTDTTFYGGQINKFLKRAEWTPITLDSAYIITVETDSATMSAGIVTNDWVGVSPNILPNGRKENLNCGSISGLWYQGKNLNVSGVPFDCDVLLHPYVKYKFGTDFSIKNNCYALNDSIRFTNAAPSNMSGARMYNRYLLYNLGYFCHWWDVGDGWGTTYSVDHKVQYNSKANYKIQLISTVYQYKGVSYSCDDTTEKILYFKPDIPTFTGLTNLCVGDSAKFTAVTNDTGVTFEWSKKQFGVPPFFIGQEYKKFPLTKDDTIYLRANNRGCLSGVRTIILKVNAYPSSLTVKDDSICAGSKANLKGTTNVGTIQWYTTPTGGLPFFSGSVYQTKILNKDTTFYAQAGNNGCVLNPRKAVKAYVGSNFAPSAPVVSNDTTLCMSAGGGVILNAAATAGLTVRWYDVSTGGTSINTGNTFGFTPTKREVKTFYADAYNGVCASTRVPIVVTVEDYPAITKIMKDTICKGGDSAYLSFSMNFGTANWYDANTGGNLVHTGTYLASAPTATTDYYIETNSDVCKNPTRTKITALVNTFPSITRLWGDTICAKNKATLKSILNGSGTLEWYESDTSNTLLGTGKTFKTPVINGTKMYWAQPVYAGCVGPRQSVQPLVKAAPFSGFSFEVMTWQRLKVSPINAVGSSIQWDFGDGTTSTLNTVTHRFENTGTYQVKLILTSLTTGCKDSTTVTVLIETSSIQSVSQLPGVSIYPNPASLVLNMRSGLLGNEKAKVNIYSSTGALLMSLDPEAKDGLLTIPVSGLAAGLYILHIEGFAPLTFVRE